MRHSLLIHNLDDGDGLLHSFGSGVRVCAHHSDNLALGHFYNLIVIVQFAVIMDNDEESRGQVHDSLQNQATCPFDSKRPSGQNARQARTEFLLVLSSGPKSTLPCT